MLDDIVVDKNDIFGHCTTASFKTSGRAKPLMGDAIHYATMRQEEKFSNMGPGSYEFRDIWSSNDRMTVRVVPTGTSILSKPVGGVPFADKPWKQPPPLIKRKKPKPGSNLPPPVAKKPGVILDVAMESDAKQLQRDIETVRNLPHYG